MTAPSSTPPSVAGPLRALGDRRAAPSVRWVAALTGAPATQVRKVLAELGKDLAVEQWIHDRHREGGRAMYAQIRAPFELYAIARLLRPDHVVETGVSSGVSSAHFLLALQRNRHGRLHSIDRPTRQRGTVLAKDESGVSLPPGRDSGWAVPRKLRRGWDLRIGPSQQLLPRLASELPSIDLFLHDSLHTPTHLTFELETIRPKLRAGGVVLADNTAWTGQAFPRFARSLGARMVRRGRGDLVGLRVPAEPSARP
jgi:predicted O-methyltransferase YrrM